MFLTILFALLAIAGLGTAFLLEAHWEMRSVSPDLPEREEIFRALGSEDGPIRIRFVNTASQEAAGRKVIHPSYILEWADGRIFLIEVGMDKDGAEAFGRTMERFLGSDPIAFHGSVAAQMGAALDRVAGVAVSHLHIDHTGGIGEICETVTHQITVFQTDIQAMQGNYVTAPGLTHLQEASCASRVVLEGARILTFVDFPGLIAVSAGGHTPGSTVYFANVNGTVWALAGDITWTVEDITTNTPKPTAYSTLIVPEYGARMEELRVWLRDLNADPRVHVLVSHGEQALIDTGLERFER